MKDWVKDQVNRLFQGENLSSNWRNGWQCGSCAYGATFAWPTGMKAKISSVKEPVQFEELPGDFYYRQQSVAVELDEYNTFHYSIVKRQPGAKHDFTKQCSVVKKAETLPAPNPRRALKVWGLFLNGLSYHLINGRDVYNYPAGWPYERVKVSGEEIRACLKDKVGPNGLLGFIIGEGQDNMFNQLTKVLPGTVIHESDKFNNRNYHYPEDRLTFLLYQLKD